MSKYTVHFISSITICLLIMFITFPCLALAEDGIRIKHNGKILQGDPIFTIVNMLPGDTATESIEIKNKGKKAVTVGVKGVKTTSTNPPLASTLTFFITENGNTIFSGPTLQDFFDKNLGVSLGRIEKNQKKTFTFKSKFPNASGNRYQNQSVVFTLYFAANPPVLGTHSDNDDRDQKWKFYLGGKCFCFRQTGGNHHFTNFYGWRFDKCD